MPRKQSAETRLREVRRCLQAANTRAGELLSQRDAWAKRATAAEAELAEWKRRFDLLLERSPKT